MLGSNVRFPSDSRKRKGWNWRYKLLIDVHARRMVLSVYSGIWQKMVLLWVFIGSSGFAGSWVCAVVKTAVQVYDRLPPYFACGGESTGAEVCGLGA